MGVNCITAIPRNCFSWIDALLLGIVMGGEGGECREGGECLEGGECREGGDGGKGREGGDEGD